MARRRCGTTGLALLAAGCLANRLFAAIGGAFVSAPGPLASGSVNSQASDVFAAGYSRGLRGDAARLGRTGRNFFGKADDEGADTKTDTKKEKARESQSDDGFIMPRNPEEEAAYQASMGAGGDDTKEKMWRSDFDDLPDSEKLLDFSTQTAIWSVLIPVFIGAYVLVTQMPSDDVMPDLAQM
eukprot:TRINITY_DN15817_c0_g1_i1.p1 TRINITY_DN15817_c0_g1~~TRINITY_DN15817_c0_g1_i1.p1  ORF type:complete len:211 (-),score=55.30 TRINITY_DN15817_c0_g1_i1:303-851(-)